VEIVVLKTFCIPAWYEEPDYSLQSLQVVSITLYYLLSSEYINGNIIRILVLYSLIIHPLLGSNYWIAPG
jgi:hypothetical protein